ncbi:MAG: hypothetical protein ACLPVY_21515 [Acidimicrobiia bacterium]
MTGHLDKAVLGVVAMGLCLVGAVLGSGVPASAATTAAVPVKYQTEYDQTRSDLDAYARTIDAMPSYSSKPTSSHFGFVELLDANGNRQSALLKPTAMTGVDQSLDAFKRLGVGGVVIGVKLPLLLPQYTSQASQYARFFANVAKAARARGFVIDVELGALFCGTVYADCSYTYPTSVAGWASLIAQQARTVIDTMHPDYLDLISEPNTEAILTKITDLQTIDGFRSFVSDALTDIGGHGTTKLMAGAASWFPASYDQAIIRSGIDGLITHIYPATAETAANLVATSRVAHDAGKPIIADEVWLYKGQTTASGSVQASNEQGALNCFSFWQPLDVQFIRATREWAQKTGSPLMSGFWSWEAFAYTPWTPLLDAQPSQQIQSKNYTAAQTALTAGLFTATGFAIVGK